jgi:hypothetical protein
MSALHRALLLILGPGAVFGDFIGRHLGREVQRRRLEALPPGMAVESHFPSVVELLAAGDRLAAIVRAEVARQLAAQDLIDEEKLP